MLKDPFFDDDDDEELEYSPPTIPPSPHLVKPVDHLFDPPTPTPPTGIHSSTLKKTHVVVSKADVEAGMALDRFPADQRMFILALASFGTESRACMEARVTKDQIREWKKDPKFAVAVERASHVVADMLEEELLRRALGGSDKLLVEAVRAHKPDKYSPRTSADINVKGAVVHSWADLAKAAMTGTIEDVDYTEVEEE